MRTISILLLIAFFTCSCNESDAPESTGGRADDAGRSGINKPLQERDPSSFKPTKESLGQLVYVPVYSHIYQHDRQKTFNLTATLSIRNSDPFRSISISEVLYYDSEGKLIEQYVEDPVRMGPLASTSYVIEERDLRGGVGANFLISWHADEAVYPPVIEAVMISTSQQQGISFLSTGRVLENYQPDTLRTE